MKTTRKSLLVSGLSLVLSVAILMGATFAWFTDSVTNSGNTIQAGKLEVGFQYKSLTGTDYQAVPTDSGEMGQLFANQLWEPGYSNGLDLKVVNNGTLALKWQLYFTNVQSTGGQNNVKLADVLDVYVIGEDDTAAALTDANKLGTLSGLAGGLVHSGTLTADSAETEFSVVLKMHEDAGNDYQNATVTFDVELRATQAPYEADGFHSTQYDAAANGEPDEDWDTVVSGSASASKPDTGSWADTTTLSVGGASVDVPAGAIAEGSSEIELSVVPTTKPEGVQVESDQTAVAYDISVTGLKDDNTAEISVKLYVGTGLANVKVYHNSDAVTGASYDSATGYVTFTTTSFSPFTVVHDGKLVAYVNGVPYGSFTRAVIAADNGGTVELVGSADQPLAFGYTGDWTAEGPSASEPNTYGNNLYSYEIKDVTLTSHGSEPVTIKGMSFVSGRVSEPDPTDASKSSYYEKLTISGLTVENIQFTDVVTLGSATKGLSLISGVTFKNCGFDMAGSSEKYKDALIFNAPSGLSERDKYFPIGTVIEACSFTNCRRSISFASKAKNTTVSGCTFTDCSWGIRIGNTVGNLYFTDNTLKNGGGAITINTVANDYAAHDNSSNIVVTGNVMLDLTEAYVCQTTYDNGKSAGKSTYTISSNDWGETEVQGFRIKSTYGPSMTETISDTAPITSAGV